MKLRHAAFALVFQGLAAYSFAAPEITKVTGDPSNGQTATISGRNFTVATSLVSPVFDMIENQPLYAGLKTGDAVPAGKGLWKEVTVMGTYTRPMSMHIGNCRGVRNACYKGYGNAHLDYLQPLEGKPITTLYSSWWFNPSEDPNGRGGSNKFLRVWDDPNGRGTRTSWTPETLGTMYDSNPVVTKWAQWAGKVGQWNRMELLQDGASGTIKVWVNGQKVYDMTGYVKSNNGIGLNVGLVGFNATGNIAAGTYDSLKFMLSDIYVADNIARVEISDKPTWSDTTAIKEIQPAISRTDTEIKIKLNQGAIRDLKSAYLYVVDKTGQVNEKGIPLKPAAPAAPVLQLN